jgi:hypothetical protein
MLFPCRSNCHYQSDVKTPMTDQPLTTQLKTQTAADRLDEQFFDLLILYPNMIELLSQVTTVVLCHNRNEVTPTLGTQEHFHHNKMPCKH